MAKQKDVQDEMPGRPTQSLNEAPSAAERDASAPTKLDSGPKIGDRGEYLPAAYRTPKGLIRQDR